MLVFYDKINESPLNANMKFNISLRYGLFAWNRNWFKIYSKHEPSDHFNHTVKMAQFGLNIEKKRKRLLYVAVCQFWASFIIILSVPRLRRVNLRVRTCSAWAISKQLVDNHFSQVGKMAQLGIGMQKGMAIISFYQLEDLSTQTDRISSNNAAKWIFES